MTSFKRFVRLRIVVRGQWFIHSLKPIKQDKIVFIETTSPVLSNSFTELFNTIVRNYEMDIHCHFMMTGKVKKTEEFKRQLEFVKDAATAKYIIANDSSYLFGQMKKRRGQHFLNTWHGCGAFKRFGLGTADKIFGDSEKIIRKYPLHPHYDFLTTSSPEVEWAYVESIGAEKHPESVRGIGVSRTDVFFREEFISDAKKSFYARVPQANSKKVILYAPTFRGRVRNGRTPNMLDLGLLYEKFNEEYILVYKYHPFSKDKPRIEPQYNQFAFDLSDMEIDILLCVADICISDYSSLIFEFSLFEKPLIFFVYDFNNYFDWRGFYYSFEELAPGAICYTNAEVTDYIEHVDERFDRDRIRRFREKFMSACDGHATERIMESFFGGEIEQYRRETPLVGTYNDIPKNEKYSDYAGRLSYYAKVKKRALKGYRRGAKEPLRDNTVALVVDENTSASIFSKTAYILKKKGVEVVEDVEITEKNALQYAYALSRVKVILCAGEPYILRMLDIREDTRIIQVSPEILPLYPKWNQTKERRSSYYLEETREYPIHTAYDAIISSSEQLDDYYLKNYTLKPGGKLIHCGNLQTDYLYGEKAALRDALKAVIPSLEDKKIILMMFMKRHEIRNVLINTLTAMHERFARDYVCLIDCNDEGMASYTLPEYFQGYAINLKSEYAKLEKSTEMTDAADDEEEAEGSVKLHQLSRMEQIRLADIVVTDYCPEALSAAVTDKPLILWTPDYASYVRSHEMYVTIDDLVPHVRLDSGEDLIRCLSEIDRYDDSAQKAFAQKYLKKCDGKSARYLIDYISDYL